MIASGVCLCLVGVFQAIMDTLDFHYGSSVFARLKNQQWWDQDKSWGNKWAKAPNGEIMVNKPRFFGSSTFLVWLTDGWHLFQSVKNSTIVLAVIFFPGIPLNWWFLAYLVAGKILISVSFEGVFRLLKVKNP